MNNLERLMIGEMRDMDDAERLLQALEAETHGTLVAWAEALTAPRMIALLNATLSDDDPEGDTELTERILSQPDFVAIAPASTPNHAIPADLHRTATSSSAFRSVPGSL